MMGKKKNLTDAEKSGIELLRSENYSIRQIATIMKRSKTAVGLYLNREKSTDEKKKPGPQRKLSPHENRVIVRIAQEGKCTARKVLEKSGFNVSLRTVQRILHEHDYMEFGRLMKRPKLN